MPTYDFECTECGKQVEIVASMSESDVPPEEQKDDKCTEHKWKKVILGAPAKRYGANWGNWKKGGYNSSGGDW